MFGRLVMKSLLVICAVAMLMSSIARAEEYKTLSLDEIKDLPAATNKILKSRDYSPVDKLDLILQRKMEVDTSLNRLIIERQISPSDIARENTDAGKAMKVAEILTALAQLELVDGEFTENSCAEAAGILRMGATKSPADGGEVDMDRIQSNAYAVLKNLCR